MSQPSNAVADRAVDRAIDAFAAGRPVLVHDFDDREGEVDMIYPAQHVTPADVATLRNDAGGLLCVALGADVADAFDLPFMADVLDHPAAVDSPLGYDDRSSFSLTVNHRETYTGITDVDRATTIAALGDAAAAPETTDFAAEFRAPGHVHLLRAAADGLDERRGHTEMGVALAEAAGLPPAAVVTEMLDDRTGRARTTADARDYADRHDLPYLEGEDVVDVLG